MAGNNDRFIEERARALAMMHLTRRDDLVVRPQDQDWGVDYLVDINREEKGGLRTFGIVLNGEKSPVTIEHANRLLRRGLRKMGRIGETLFPVCLFSFTMDDNQGYYTWYAEPVVRDEQPRLHYHATASGQPLTRAALDEIVAQVDRWYDVFYVAIKD